MKHYVYAEDSEYNQIYTQSPLFGLTPDQLREKFNITEDAERAAIAALQHQIDRSLRITLFMVPRGAPRPRSSGNSHFYVSDAAKLRGIIKKIYPTEDSIINTRATIRFNFYLPTPINKYNDMEILMAERKMIVPESAPDFDNLPKGYTDALQGTVIANDNIVSVAHIYKYYSVTPRIDMYIGYASGMCNEDKAAIIAKYLSDT